MTTARTRPRRRLPPDQRRAELLDAAEAVVLAVGPAGLVMEDLARRADVNKSLLYHYFGSRDGLLVALQERSYERMRAEIDAAVGLEPTPRDKLRAVVRAWLDPSPAAQIVELINAGAPVAGLDAVRVRQSIESVRGLTDLVGTITSTPTDRALAVATTFVAGCQGYAYAWRLLGWSVDDAVDAYVAMFLAALDAPI